MSQQLFHPDFKPEPYWWEAARPDTAPTQTLPDKSEILIVGSGYGGLATALELRRNGRDVTVCEADAFGEGASS